MSTTPFIFILYDSMQNSVFTSQVLEPLRNHKAKNPDQKIVLISFEPQKIPYQKILEITHNNGIEIIEFKRYPFTCTASLWPAIKKVKKVLSSFSSYTIIARGPHAGWIARYAATQHHCQHITIQARGLLAEELAYAMKNNNSRLYAWLNFCRIYSLKKLEKRTYGFSEHETKIPLTIEAVSPALKEYLITRYHINPQHVTVACNDIPELISRKQLQQWRIEIRTKLGIASQTHVYCYNGSLKPWSCPNQVIEFFANQLSKRSNSFLLVLTQEKSQFIELLQQHAIDPSRYFVCTIGHHDVYHYLAASDTGLIFREQNIINWVSRPTKVLEYQAARLNIIHNNTVALLINQK